jgi:hypothetical protein
MAMTKAPSIEAPKDNPKVLFSRADGYGRYDLAYSMERSGGKILAKFELLYTRYDSPSVFQPEHKFKLTIERVEWYDAVDMHEREGAEIRLFSHGHEPDGYNKKGILEDQGHYLYLLGLDPKTMLLDAISNLLDARIRESQKANAIRLAVILPELNTINDFRKLVDSCIDETEREIQRRALAR